MAKSSNMLIAERHKKVEYQQQAEKMSSFQPVSIFLSLPKARNISWD